MRIKAQQAANNYPNEFRVLPCRTLTCKLTVAENSLSEAIGIPSSINSKGTMGELLLLQIQKVYSRLIPFNMISLQCVTCRYSFRKGQ